LGGPSTCPITGTSHTIIGVPEKYYNIGSGFWGGFINGFCNEYYISGQDNGDTGNYWTSVSYDSSSGYKLTFSNSPLCASPQGVNNKSSGLALRCVRDN
jgi:hypothetical protein